MDHNSPGAESEYYHHGFKDLCRLVGQPRALQIVEQYKSQPFDNIPCVKSSRLISTYQNPETDNETLNLLDRRCSVFYPPIDKFQNKGKPKHLTLRQIIDLIRSERFKPETDGVKLIDKKTEKKRNREFKAANFCYATFSGTFSYSSDESLIQHSCFICVDLDDLDERLLEVQAKINADTATIMSFISPNGDGLKVVYEMDPKAYSQLEYYKAYTNYLNKLCGLKPKDIDSSCSNVSRACFLSHDPDIFVNPYFAAQ